MLKILRFVTLTAFLGLGTVHGQNVVQGKVLNFDGEPAINSSVEAFPIRDGGFAGDLTWTKVDDKGNFRLTLREGRYEIRAKDESEGYPDPNALLSVDPDALFPEVTVAKDNISGVQVRLGHKGGMLEGNVSDLVTQSAIANAKITIRDATRPQAYVEVFSDKEGNFRYTVPSRPLSVSAAAPGQRRPHFKEVSL